MVRIKHRYLLVHVLNPESSTAQSKIIPTAETSLPDLVQFHPPCPEDFTPSVFIRAIKNQVQYLYGDYGLGVVSSGLSSTLPPIPVLVGLQ